MAQTWKQLKKFKDDNSFLDYLVDELKLPNADAIYNKLATVQGGIIPYAHGTRRLRYAAGTFYVEQAEGPPPLTDVGVGKHIAVKALQERWQGMAGRALVSVKLDKTMQSAVSYGEYEKGGKLEVRVKLNPLKLKGPKQVEERVLWIDKCLTE